MGPLRRFGMIFAAAVLLALIPRLPADAAETHYVSPNGDDSASGTESSPWGTFQHALSQLEPGDVLVARGGTYEEEVVNPNLASGTENSPITVKAAPGERPVIQGLLWLRDADYWRFDGINVTWGNAAADDHMIKMTGGTGWEYVNSEIWGAHSYAGMLVAAGEGGEPDNWRVAGNCIHDTYPSNDTNQDHLIYANSGPEGSGVIEGNVMFNAPNGEAVKLGGPDPDVGGSSNITVRYNTMVDAAQTVLISWQSWDNTIERNLMVGAGDGYSNIRAYQLSGDNNVARNNLGYDSEGMIDNYDGGEGIEDGGGNLHGVNPRFDSVGCNGFTPTNPEAQGYGHTALPGAPGGGNGGSGDGSGEGNGSGGGNDSVAAEEADGAFVDDEDSVFEGDINRLARAGITFGCNPPESTRFCPDDPVTRGQMAAFLTRTMDLKKGSGSDRFVDDDASVFEADIGRLARAGITVGCNPPRNDRFCGDESVSRAQMASFLARAQGLDGGSDRFRDISGSVHAADIRALAKAKVTFGCNPPENDRFCPGQNVTRGQMAAFLVRAFDL